MNITPEEFKRVLIEAKRKLDDAARKGYMHVGKIRVDVHGRVLSIHPSEIEGTPVSVIGDIHGDANTLRSILGYTMGSLRIFVGDYVDRGPPAGQVYTLYTLLKLFIDNDTIILLRGNHEPPEGLEPVPHDYPQALASYLEQIGENPQMAGELYDLSFKLFNSLPHALIIEGKALIVHGGIPRRAKSNDKYEYLGGNTLKPPMDILEDILWSDPTDKTPDYLPNPRGAGILWGPRLTLKAISITKARIIIRGHETAPLGFKVDHNGRVLTLFSRVGKPYGNTRAGFLYCRDVNMIEVDKKVNLGCVYVLKKVMETAVAY